MKAAIVHEVGASPVYGEFDEAGLEAAAAAEGMELVRVSASALSPFSKLRSTGKHYSSGRVFPVVAGADGVGRTADGRRVYFVLPEAPYGALAEKTLVRSRQCIAVPDEVDDVTAAAIVNPGMSGWAALVERARLVRGETVLVHGATSTAGRLAVQIAKHLGAARVIGTGRNERELEELLSLGVDKVIPFRVGADHPNGAQAFESALIEEFGRGIDVVVDYLWGESAKAVITAIARAVEEAHPVRFVHVGSAAGERNVDLPGEALRSSAIQLMGSGVKSVPMVKLLEVIGQVLAAVKPAGLSIATKTMPLAEIAEAWSASAKPRIVCTV
ncbi:quinone oxidoreductase family protein [Silvibacterium dinghuense]|uniref:Zinc-binding alcohol dehydrogenase family protein n=1 Tax=Silvibacterium dinghuense TaxID=1560006 RepID=A0A4Q1SEJ9_9BACT|nr:zinc-binding alcohol dehydrogenase family protein [Silvibacterium dinghuense]RXS95553.1 zinc-binding alcohol dehydrogenase family protein [Silvibacterium dinghuense]GGH13972.1 zinc-binding dehydrogenase [Silvibacterium dinghuense]